MLKLAEIDSLPRLQHDAAIIDEQPEYVVLAVKVSRQALRDNHPLLACLSERASETPKNGQRLAFIARPTPRSHRRLIASLGAFMGVAILTVAGFKIVQPTAAPEAPLVNQRVWLPKPVISVGEPLTIAFESQRKRLCRTDVERMILNSDGYTVFSERQSGIGQALTDKPFARQVQLRLPDGLKPGNYTYRSHTYSDCGPGDQHSLPSGDLAFELLGKI